MYQPTKESLPAWAWIILIIVVLVLVSSFVNTAKKDTPVIATPTAQAVTTNTTVAPTKPTNKGKINDSITANGYTLVVNGIERKDSYQEYTKAKPGNIMLAVDLTITNKQDKPLSVSGGLASIKDANGFNYDTAIFSKEPRFPTKSGILKDDKVRGWITFEVPLTAKDLVFEYKGIFENQPILVDLGE